MIQPRTQTRDYWEHEFLIAESDFEQITNHFLEVMRPQATADLGRVVMRQRIAEERSALRRRVAGRKIYQPREQFAVGDPIIFPAFDFATAHVLEVREGHNPQQEPFQVIAVEMKGRRREFAAGLTSEHAANVGAGGIDSLLERVDVDELYGYVGTIVEARVMEALLKRPEFIYMGSRWYMKSLLAEVNIGHLHLAEAALDMSGGGPLTTDGILVYLDIDPAADRETQKFTLNYALLNDTRFDEVAPKGQVAWFLRRMEPAEVQAIPERLAYEPIAFDPALLSPQLQQIQREIADEWSDIPAPDFAQEVTLTLIYPHRLLGTLPMTGMVRKLLPLGRSPRQIVAFRDAETGEEFPVWAVQEGRYLYGLKQWYDANEIVVGGRLTLRRSNDPAVLIINYERRRPQREDVRLATVVDNRLRFELQRRSVRCGYDELMVVGTDYTAAIEAIWKRVNGPQPRSLASLLAAVLPELTVLSTQDAVHSKTVYSVINMLRRVPPGPLFAELVRHPAFQAVGDDYWRFNARRWQRE